MNEEEYNQMRMQEFQMQQQFQQPKPSMGKRILNGTVAATVAVSRSAFQNVQNLRRHMYMRQMELQKGKGKRGNGRPLPNEEYKIVMSKKNKRKLGMNFKW